MENSTMHHNHYKKLFAMAILSFVSIYLLMYSMVDRFENIIPGIDQLYMAAVMTAPMLIIEIILMRSMYVNKS